MSHVYYIIPTELPKMYYNVPSIHFIYATHKNLLEVPDKVLPSQVAEMPNK